MRLLRTDTKAYTLTTFDDEKTLPPYAIVSHTWLAAEEEVTYSDLTNVSVVRSKPGNKKLSFAIEQAARDGIGYVWLDTCCIDKSSSAELAEAINSMYRWYRKAEVCYAYLDDMPALDQMDRPTFATVYHSLSQCRWFTRGWTLQEMLAPPILRFYDQSWYLLGTLKDMADSIAKITGVHAEVLRKDRKVESYSIAQRMYWASARKTIRVEDRAYSLLGIFDVNIGVIYGEGRRAFQRLQEELLRHSSDQTIFGWSLPKHKRNNSSLLATSPTAFKDCRHMVPATQGQAKSEFQVANGRVQFKLLPVLEYPSTLKARNQKPPLKGIILNKSIVLSCLLQDDCTKVVILDLEGDESAALSRRTMRLDDNYDATQRYTRQTLDVYLYQPETQAAYHSIDTGNVVIICRYLGQGDLRLVKRYPGTQWKEPGTLTVPRSILEHEKRKGMSELVLQVICKKQRSERTLTNLVIFFNQKLRIKFDRSTIKTPKWSDSWVMLPMFNMLFRCYNYAPDLKYLDWISSAVLRVPLNDLLSPDGSEHDVIILPDGTFLQAVAGEIDLLHQQRQLSIEIRPVGPLRALTWKVYNIFAFRFWLLLPFVLLYYSGELFVPMLCNYSSLLLLLLFQGESMLG